MTVQFSKEVRPLIVPWAVALTGAAAVAVVAAEGEAGQFAQFVAETGYYAFLGGLALLAALIFGSEFQYRTLTLLLSQPAKRSRVWSQKMLLVGMASALPVLVGTGLYFAFQNTWTTPLFGADQVILSGLFVLATICSACYWTLVAGSTVGGLVLTVAVEFLCGLVVTAVAARVSGRDEPFQFPGGASVIAAGVVIYCAAFLWLGWRKFITLQLRDASWTEGRGLSLWFGRGWLPSWLICRDNSPMANLLRKEIRLHRPIFETAGLFVLCWVVILLLNLFLPHRGLVGLLTVTTFLYVPLCSLLAGCIPLAEEKAAGLNATQLTLPIRATVQWMVKLVCGLVVGLLAGEALAWFLAGCTSMWIGMDNLLRPEDQSWLAIGLISVALFVLGFWAIHLVSNTVKAALVAVVGAGAIVGFIALGIWAGMFAGRFFDSGVLVDLMCNRQVSPEFALVLFRQFVMRLDCWMVAVVAIIMLYQAFRQFRRAQPGNGALIGYSSFLGLLIFLTSLVSVTLLNSAERLPNSQPVQELRSALNAIAWSDRQIDRETTRTVSMTMLNGRVTPQTLAWVKNATITYQFAPAGLPGQGAERYLYLARVVFPNGQSFEFNGSSTSPGMLRRYGR